MTLFIQRFIGALTLDPLTYEDVESDAHSSIQAAGVVLLICLAAGFAARGLGGVGFGGFVAGAFVMLCGWLVWVTTTDFVGTHLAPEPQTHSNVRELIRTMGFAAAPGIFLGFAAMRAVAPTVLAVVAVWMIAASVLAVRQALDYRSTGRAIGVSITGGLLSVLVIAVIGLLLSSRVS